MDVSPYEAGLVRFLHDKFGLSEPEAIGILKNDKTREDALELFKLYISLQEQGYDFTPVKYVSTRTLKNVLKLLASIKREVVKNPYLHDGEKTALLHVLRAFDLNAEIEREGYLVIKDVFLRRLKKFVKEFVRLFEETGRVMQVDERELAGVFERIAKEAGVTKGLDELMANLNPAEEVLERCKRLDVIKRIKETAHSTLWSREWYDEGIKNLLTEVIRASSRTLKSKGCTPETIAKVVLQGPSVVRLENLEVGSPEEVLEPFVRFVGRKVDLIAGIIRRKPGALELIRLSSSRLTEIERGIEVIRNSLRVDMKTAPWEVLENAKRLDELERRVCSSLREEVEIQKLDNLETVLKVVRLISGLCPGIKPVVRVEFREED
jgi:hypothetical protein